MKDYHPTYYEAFRCIAGACRDSCCIGWEIDIDPHSVQSYRQVPGALGEKLRRSMAESEEGCSFRLEGERCPFLTREGLCQLILELGPQSLCDICREHPRFHQWFGPRRESGLGLCCEAAGRLIFSQEETTFVWGDCEEAPEPFEEEEAYQALFIAREKALAWLSRRELSFAQRLLSLLTWGEELQEALDWEDWETLSGAELYPQPLPPVAQEAAEKAARRLLDFLLEQEPLDPAWPKVLGEIQAQLPQLLDSWQRLCREDARQGGYFRQLSVTLLFRYLSQSLWDGALEEKLHFLALGCAVVALLNGWCSRQLGTFSLEEQVQSAKSFSKELEYAAETQEALAQGRWSPAPREDLAALCGFLFADLRG